MADDLKRVGLVFTEEGAIDFKKSLKDINIEMQKNYNQFKLTQAQWDDSITSTQKLTEEQKYLQNAYEIQTSKVAVLKGQLAELESAENKNVSAIKKKQNELTNAELKLKKYGNKLDEIEKTLKNTGKAIEEYGKKIESVGEKIDNASNKVTAFSAATGAAFLASAKTAIDFETAFTGVEKTVTGTEEQFEELKQGIRDMAKEMPSSTTEISAVAEAAGQLGIQTENILGFSKAMINLGNSTNLSAEEAASELAKFANIMQMSQKDFDKLGSSIVDLGNNFATTEADIVAMAMRLAGAGKQVGLSEGEVLGLATALSSVGIEAEMGGSAISKAMVKMQNAVENGGKKLDDLKKKTGMSLRELELLASNSSMDFKYLCNDIGMTSKEVKNLITAGTNLEDFARISGKTSEQFKKDWKEDAIDTLSAFIKGLGNAEEKGESAITMLTDMGLTEVRLRDSLLRAANAGKLFSNAIEKGNEAFEDNTALANEANKRYATLESKINIALNKAKDLALTFGNKLTPALDKGLDKIDDLSETVRKLTDEQIEFILKVGATVVALGPLLKITGKLTTAGGKAIKTIGTITQAVGVANGKITSTSTAVTTLVKVLSSITSPVGFATLAIGSLVTIMAAHEIANAKERESLGGLREEINAQKTSWDELAVARNENLSNSISEISNYERLTDELSKITEQNGKVKEGYESRAQVILNTLNSALGTEYKMNDNIIQQYEDLKSNIDKVIASKKAEALLNAYQLEYEQALKKQSEATENLVKLKQQLNDINDKIATSTGRERAEYELTRTSIAQGINDQMDLLGNYGKTIQDYENLQKASLEGTTEAIQDACKNISSSYKQVEKDTKDSIDGQIQNQLNYIKVLKETLEDAKTNNEQYQAEILQSQLESSNKQLQNLTNSLVKQTSTINELTPEQINAYKNLANASLIEYSNALAQLPEETRKKIEASTGIISCNTGLPASAGALADNALATFESHLNTMSNIANNKITDTSNVINNDTLVPTAAANLANKAENAVRSNNSNVWGEDLVEGLGNDIRTKSNGSWFNGVLNSLSGKISSRFKGVFTSNNSFNLPGHKLGLEYVPKDNYIARLHKGERVLTKEENKDYTEAIEDKRPVTSKTNTNYQNSNVVVENIIDYDKLTNCFITAISKIGLFIDENTLVGHTAPKMNQALATIKEKEERGG